MRADLHGVIAVLRGILADPGLAEIHTDAEAAKLRAELALLAMSRPEGRAN